MKDYGSICITRADEFTKQNTPSTNNTNSSCKNCCPSPVLVGRFILRNSIPLILGLMAGIGIKWCDEALDGPEFIIASSQNNTLLEISDIVNSCVTLFVAYGMDCLLDKCWPARPYNMRQSRFFQSVSTNDDTDFAMQQTGFQAT